MIQSSDNMGRENVMHAGIGLLKAFDNFSDYIFVSNSKGQICYSNPAARKALQRAVRQKAAEGSLVVNAPRDGDTLATQNKFASADKNSTSSHSKDSKQSTSSPSTSHRFSALPDSFVSTPSTETISDVIALLIGMDVEDERKNCRESWSSTLKESGQNKLSREQSQSAYYTNTPIQIVPGEEHVMVHFGRLRAGQDPKQARELLSPLAEVSGIQFFEALSQLLHAELGMKYVFIGEMQDPKRKQMEVVLASTDGDFSYEGYYLLANSPCGRVFNTQEISAIPGEVLSKFPDGEAIQQLKAQSYLGIPLKSHSGEHIGVLCVLHTEAVSNSDWGVLLLGTIGPRASAELQRLREKEHFNRTELQKRQASKLELIGQLAGGLAHDFNNMLSIILGSADLALNQKIPSSARDHLESLIHTAGDAAKMTQQLLGIGKENTSKRAGAEIYSLLRGMQPMLEQLMTPSIPIQYSIPDGEAWIALDSVQIQQIILNLVVNSKNAMPDGGSLSIKLFEAVSDAGVDDVKIVVSDSGCGMKSEQVSRACDPFYSTSQSQGGTGIGLATVLMLVESCGGRLEIESEKNKGTSVEINLPLQSHQNSATEGAAKAPSSGQKQSAAQIYVVEDDPALLEIISQQFEFGGHAVRRQADPVKAREHLSKQLDDYDLIVLDLVMPNYSGQKLAMDILETNHEKPILFISGYSEDSLPENLQSLDNVAFLQKPFSGQDLRSKLEIVKRHGNAN